MTDKLRITERPCSSCPLVVSTPAGIWSAEEYERLATYDEEPCMKAFLCHHSALGSAPTVCRGWLARWPDSVGARLLVARGELADEERFTPLPDDVVLYESGTAARDAGLAGVDAPSVQARRVIDKLVRKQDRSKSSAQRVDGSGRRQ